MEQKLEQLTKVLRYSGLNLTPQILQVILDKNVVNLVNKLSAKLDETPNLALEDIDVIIAEIQAAAQAEADAMAVADTKAEKTKASKLEKA